MQREKGQCFVLDENISEFNHLVAVAQDNAADVVNIKISKSKFIAL